MFKWLSIFLFLICTSVSVFASLNESTKPEQMTVYLEQNLPYSGFDAYNKSKGLYADFWNLFSLHTGIAVKYTPYFNEPLSALLADNKPAIYSGLTSSSLTTENFIKVPVIEIKSDFYYLNSASNHVSKALIDRQNTIVVGGLLPEAQQLPLLQDKANIIYREYPGLLELLLDLYNNKIDALVVFSAGNSTGIESSSLLDSALTTMLIKMSLDSRHNQLNAYLHPHDKTLAKWIAWGNQFEQIEGDMRRALVDKNNPWWGASATMTRNLLIASGILLVFVLIGRTKRKKDRQFKDVLDSSPYPLAIFSLDGNTIFYLNDEVKSLFPFKRKKKKYLFEETENQLLLSRFINKASHQTLIDNGLVRLLVDDKFHDIEIFAKRIHYKRQTAWLCHLKDVTALLSAERKLIEERELLRKVLDSIPEQIAFKSPKGTIIGCNKSWAEANSTTVAHATGRSVADLMDIPRIKKQKQQEAMVWTGETYNTQEWTQQSKATDLSLINITKVPLYNDKGTIFAILSIDSDITALHNLTKQLKDENLQRKETEKALSKQSVLLSTVFAASYDPIGLLDDEGRILGANNSFAKLMDAKPEEIIGKLQSELLSADRADWAARQNYEVLDSGEPMMFEELLFSGDKKTWYEVHKAPFKDDESHSKGVVIMARDITARKLTEEKLSSDASDFEQKMLNDQLTNIANRRSFDAHYAKLWKETSAEQEMLSIVMCDIDYFKPYNDNYGHQQGDEALKAVALALQHAANEMGCFAARYGGEEFIVVIKGGNATKVLKATERLREAVNEIKIEHLYSKVSRYITMSMGLSSIFPSDLNTMKMLVAEADAALYDAKMSGRDQISVHD